MEKLFFVDCHILSFFFLGISQFLHIICLSGSDVYIQGIVIFCFCIKVSKLLSHIVDGPTAVNIDDTFHWHHVMARTVLGKLVAFLRSELT